VIDIGLDPVLVRIGPLSVHGYGLMYVVGIVAALAVSVPYAERRGIGRDAYYAVFWPVAVAALIGGRLYYVVQSNFGWYLQHPQQIFATWEGGMAFYGAVFLGTVAAYLASRRAGVSFARALDVAAVFIPVAQTFGRVGNVVNGDIIGYSSSLPWAVRYTNPANTFVPSHTTAYQPASAYELLFSLVLFVLVWRLRFRLKPSGSLFALWLVGYSLGQVALFFARQNTVVWLGLKQAQITALAVILVAVPVWLWWRRIALSDLRTSSRQADRSPAEGPGVTGSGEPA
jgi:phosphatidylglycerol:prolipoprotein diacylglycerol transferase